MTAELDFLGSLFNGSPLASSIVGTSPGASGAGAAGLAAQHSLVPELDARWADDLFKQQSERPSQKGPPGTGWSTSEVNTDGMDRSTWKWDLGGNTVGSFIKRGAAATGLDRMSSEAPVYGNGEWSGGPNPDRWASDYKDYQKQLTGVAQQLGMDVSSYYNTVAGSTTGQGSKAVVTPDQQILDANRLYDAIDERYKDVYLVGGMAQGLPGQTGNTGQKAVRSLYVRNGDKLVPQGDAQVYDAPENSQGFFKDAVLPALPILLAPFTAGASSALAAGIQSAVPALGAFGSAAAAGALTGGTMSALTGGDVGKGMLTGGLVGGVGSSVAGSSFAGATPFARMGTKMVVDGIMDRTPSGAGPADSTATALAQPALQTTAPTSTPSSSEQGFLDGLFRGQGGSSTGFMNSLIAKGKTLGSI
ncbi:MULTISPECIES: hypothetical protein [Giesbergeria]|uniref:Uncharacterized protein n=1 Tax=Giesbergeria sinuosa TaxID=80883 RepID=A0ABV9QDE1_9BURK